MQSQEVLADLVVLSICSLRHPSLNHLPYQKINVQILKLLLLYAQIQSETMNGVKKVKLFSACLFKIFKHMFGTQNRQSCLTILGKNWSV